MNEIRAPRGTIWCQAGELVGCRFDLFRELGLGRHQRVFEGAPEIWE